MKWHGFAQLQHETCQNLPTKGAGCRTEATFLAALSPSVDGGGVSSGVQRLHGVWVGRRHYPAEARGRPLTVQLTGLLQRRLCVFASVRAARWPRLTPRGGRGEVHRGRVWG